MLLILLTKLHKHHDASNKSNFTLWSASCHQKYIKGPEILCQQQQQQQQQQHWFQVSAITISQLEHTVNQHISD